jgi:hypothetical protein
MRTTLINQSGKKALLILAFSLVIFTSFSQTKITFCLNNSDNGLAEWPFTTITFAEKKSVRCLVNVNSGGINLHNVIFRVLLQDAKGQFKLINEYNQEVQPDWNWFYYQIEFGSVGVYKIEAVNDNNQTLTYGILHLVSE